MPGRFFGGDERRRKARPPVAVFALVQDVEMTRRRLIATIEKSRR